MLLNTCHARKEVKSLEDVWLYTENLRNHDPLGIIQKHCQSIRNFIEYVHEESSFDVVFQRASDYEQVNKRILEISNTQDRIWFLKF